MGIEDRDWYRQENAKKKGMRYNAKNATYSAEKLFSDAVRPRSNASKMHPLLLFVVTLMICAFIFVVIKTISQFLR